MTIKKMIIILIVLIFVVSLPAFSRERVAVLDFEAKDVQESDALAIADFFRSDLVAAGQFIVLERGNMQSILNEHELTMKGLTNEASASEIGELLSVNYLFLGNLSKFGNKYILVIDKINVQTGEIEKSVKKTGVNIDTFLNLSAEAAAELSGDGSIILANDDEGAYDAETLTQLISEIGFATLLDFKEIEIDTPAMQITDQVLRRELYNDNALDNSIIAMLVNAVTFGIGGNFMQGFNELGFLSIGTTAAFILSIALTDSIPLIAGTGLLYTATYAGGILAPFWYETSYNQYLKDTLLVY